MREIFISDLHLAESRPDITAAFFKFLENELKGAENLYILGDFFELWVGDDHISALNQEVIAALKKVEIPIFLMHGNRDFLMGEAFCKAIGATLLEDPSVVQVAGERVLLMHGDSLCTADIEYMQVRGLLRSEAFQTEFLQKSIPERIAFAEGARQQSQAHTQTTAAEIMDVTPGEVIQVMEAHGVQTLIHGHTHRPQCHEVELSAGLGRRFVLGDWDKTGWQIIANDGEFTLSSFEL